MTAKDKDSSRAIRLRLEQATSALDAELDRLLSPPEPRPQDETRRFKAKLTRAVQSAFTLSDLGLDEAKARPAEKTEKAEENEEEHASR